MKEIMQEVIHAFLNSNTAAHKVSRPVVFRRFVYPGLMVTGNGATGEVFEISSDVPCRILSARCSIPNADRC